MNGQRSRVDNAEIEILIAEDSATQAEQLRYLLEQKGYRVTAAPNGKLALEAARARKPRLIISDVMMPEMDGYALCKAVKADAALHDVPVIIVTTLASVQDIAMALESGADNFLRKPYDPKGLLVRVENLLSNWELRRGTTMRLGVEIYVGGRKHFITSEREQILDLLISSYEQAVQVNEELKVREAEVRVLNADLERRAKELEAANQELQSFSYSVSHDLRAPLRAIDGFSAMLEADHGDRLDQEGRHLLTRVREGAARMGQLIEDLLEFSRMGREAMAAEEIDMAQLANEALREIAHSHKGTMPRCTIGDLPPAWGDRSLLRQVWLNLLGNAVKYSSGRADAAVEVTGETDGVESAYAVRDNGAGFDMRYVDRLFGVFQRLHSNDQFPGTGVGLALVRRIVTRHGGQVTGEGKVNEGATFRFTLPRQPTDVVAH